MRLGWLCPWHGEGATLGLLWRWRRGSSSAPMDVAARLTTTRRFPPRVAEETALLTDRETVQR